MAEPNPDDVTEELRRAIAPLREKLVVKPSDFGLAYLTTEELISRAEGEGHAEGTSRRRRFAWRLPLAAGLAAAAVVTAAVALPRLGGNETDPAATAPAPSVTRTAELATYGSGREVVLAAASAPAPAPEAAPYWNVKSIQRFGSEEVPREVWIGRDRPSVLRQDGFVAQMPAVTFPIGPRSVGWQGLQTLPTQLPRLRSLLAQDAATPGRDKRWVVFKIAGELLAEAPVPPDVRQTLWRVLAAEQGARRTDRTRDGAGRVGWTVSMSIAGEGRVTYVVDPESGQLLEARHVPDDGQEPWIVTYLERGPASSAPDPAGA